MTERTPGVCAGFGLAELNTKQIDAFAWVCGLNDKQNVRVRIWYSPYNFSEKGVAGNDKWDVGYRQMAL